MTRPVSLVGITLALAITGCTQHLDVAAIAPLEDAVLVVDRDGIARVVQVDGASTVTIDVALSEGRPSLIARPGSPDQGLVLTEGRLGDADDPPVPAELVLLDRTGEIGRWTLEGQYADASVSRDGRYVVALEPRGRLVVENRVEVVDLTMPAAETNPLAISLRSLGGESPSAAEISPPIAWEDGSELRIAALFAAGQLSLFDLDAPDEAPVTIPTTADGSVGGPEPVEGFFVGTELVLRPSIGRQMLVVSLVPGAGSRRFDVAVRTLTTSAQITALAVDERGSAPRLLAATSSSLDVIDLATGTSVVVPMPVAHRSILLFEGPAPGDETVRERVALYGAHPSIGFVELGEGPAEVLGSFVLPLAFAPDDVIADPVGGRLVVFEDLVRSPSELDAAASTGRRPVSVVDLFDRSALALLAASELSRAVVSTQLTDMWVAGADGYVNRFDLSTEEQQELWLDRTAETLLPLHGDAQRVLAFSAVRTGTFSILARDGTAVDVSDAW